MNTFYYIINGIGSFNAIILFCLLVFRKNNPLPNIALSAIMFIPALYFANSILMFEGITADYPFLFFFVQFIAIGYAPAVGLYVYAILGKPLKKLWWVYTASALIGIIPIYLGIDFYGWAPAQKTDLFVHLLQNGYPESIAFYSIVFYSFQQGVFVFLLVTILKAKQRALHVHASFEHTKLLYLQNLMTLLVVLNFIIVTLYSIFNIYFVEYFLLPAIVTTIYIFIVYYAFINNAIFTKEAYAIHLVNTQELSHDREWEEANPEPSQEVINQMERALYEEELLKDQQLTVGKLAAAIDVPVSTLSAVINKELNSNFFDLINSRRIEEAKKILLSNQDFTIEGVGFESGFNSRAAFYRSFKKYTNQTPTEFLTAQSEKVRHLT